jgi:hypothetical protein
METWWFYEMPNAQAAYDAVLELVLNYSRDEVTGLGAVSREGKDDRDHLYVFVCSKDAPWPVDGIDELLDDHGRRSTITWPELVEHDGLQLYGSGDGLTLLGFLLWHYPGEIEVRWPDRRRRQRPDDGGMPPSRVAQSGGFVERMADALAWKRSSRRRGNA